jgi:hypothetical protein
MVFWRSHKTKQQQQRAASPWPELATSSDGDLPEGSRRMKTVRQAGGNQLQPEGRAAADEAQWVHLTKPRQSGAAGAGRRRGKSAETSLGGQASLGAKHGSDTVVAVAPMATRRISGSVVAAAAQQPPQSSPAGGTGGIAAGDAKQSGVAATTLTTARQMQSRQALRLRQSVKAARQLPHSDSLCFDDNALEAAAAKHRSGPAVQAAVVQIKRSTLAADATFTPTTKSASHSGGMLTGMQGTVQHASSATAADVPLTAPLLLPSPPQPQQEGHLFSRRPSSASGQPHQLQQPLKPQPILPSAEVAMPAVGTPMLASAPAPPPTHQHAEQHEIAWAVPEPTSRRATHRGASSDMLVLPMAVQSEPASSSLLPPLPVASIGTPAAAANACQSNPGSQAILDRPWQEDDSASIEEQNYVTRQLEEVAARLMAVAPRARAQSLLPGRQSIDASSGDRCQWQWQRCGASQRQYLHRTTVIKHLIHKRWLCADSSDAAPAPLPPVPAPQGSSAAADPAPPLSPKAAAATTGSVQAATAMMPAVHGADTANIVAAATAEADDGLGGDVAAMLAQLRSQGDRVVAAVGRPPLQPERQQQQLMALDDMLWRIKRCFRVSCPRSSW